MVAVISISFIFIAAVIAFAIARRFFFVQNEMQTRFQPLRPISLFGTPDAKTLAEIEQAAHRQKLVQEREKLLAWASMVKFSDLTEIPLEVDEESWDYALDILTDRAVLDDDICALVSFSLANEKFNVNQKLIEKYRQVWEKAPNLHSTAKLFELSARANDADLFLNVLCEAEQFVKSEKLSDVRLERLHDLAQSHYWLIPEPARISGAGFLLKQKLASLRRNH